MIMEPIDIKNATIANATWHHLRDDGKIVCDLCPRACVLGDGQRGLCFVRGRVGQDMVLTTYGRSSGFCIDPIEKKPLNHFYPGATCLSFGTAGCNLTCTFCQNHTISKARETDVLSGAASPRAIARTARNRGCKSVAFTYNDPVIFAEYAIDTALACREENVASIAVTAGYICSEPRKKFFEVMDAANIDLKAFSEEFYRKRCTAQLGDVLETISYVANETQCWLELTTLLIPGLNDSPEELEAMTSWIRETCGADVPLHFTAFRPQYRMRDRERTSVSILRRAQAIARENGLRYVYIGNVSDVEGASTHCPNCRSVVIARDRYRILKYELDGAACKTCGSHVPGRFAESPSVDLGTRPTRQRVPSPEMM